MGKQLNVLSLSGDGSYLDCSPVAATSAFQPLVKFSAKACEGFTSGINKNTGGNEFLNVVGGAGTSSILSGGVDADTYRRVRITAGGKVFVGAGSTAVDTTLERNAVADGGWLIVSGAVAQVPLSIKAITSGTANLFEVENSSGTAQVYVTSGFVLTGNGSGLTALVASNLASGTVPAARLGSGTAGSTTCLKGDNTWSRARNLVVAVADAATITFDLNASDKFSTTLGGNRTLALSNAVTGDTFTLYLKQDGTGSRVPAFFSGITWAGATPTLTTTAGKTDILQFTCTGTGAYLGLVVALGV